jgi:oligopeptide/dipeptide ABC transporter ATP-binding protein
VLLSAAGLTKVFRRNWFSRDRGQDVAAVRDVTISIRRGETLGVVGESGAGKSTLGRLVLRLIEPDSGTIQYNGIDLLALKRRELRKLRAGMQMVFQDPYSSLDPTMTVGEAIAEPLKIHTRLKAKARHEEVVSLLERVGLIGFHAERYPRSFSGGQLQRIAIARALASKPMLIVCDEPVAALDMSIRGQILNLLTELQEAQQLAYLFISHDLGIVRKFVDRVVVMYGGRVVESGPIDVVYDAPEHPYTRSLLSAIPVPDPSRRELNVPAARAGPLPAGTIDQGCAYRNRCEYAQLACAEVRPELGDLGGGHAVACHFPLTLQVKPAGVGEPTESAVDRISDGTGRQDCTHSDGTNQGDCTHEQASIIDNAAI